MFLAFCLSIPTRTISFWFSRTISFSLHSIFLLDSSIVSSLIWPSTYEFLGWKELWGVIKSIFLLSRRIHNYNFRQMRMYQRKMYSVPNSVLLYSTQTFPYRICNFLKMKVKIKPPKEEDALKLHLSAQIVQT